MKFFCFIEPDLLPVLIVMYMENVKHTTFVMTLACVQVDYGHFRSSAKIGVSFFCGTIFQLCTYACTGAYGPIFKVKGNIKPVKTYRFVFAHFEYELWLFIWSFCVFRKNISWYFYYLWWLLHVVVFITFSVKVNLIFFFYFDSIFVAFIAHVCVTFA